MKKSNKTNEKLVFDRFHIYDVLIVGGTIAVLLGLIFLATVFLGTLTMGRASVILGIIFLVAGGIMIGNGRSLKSIALDEKEDFYKDYRAEKKALKKQAKTDTAE